MNNFNSKINNFLGRGFTKQAQGFASVRFIHSNIKLFTLLLRLVSFAQTLIVNDISFFIKVLFSLLYYTHTC